MMFPKIDMNHELVIQPFLNGFKLIPQASLASPSNLTHGTLGHLLKHPPYNVFFLNNDSILQLTNESQAYLFGYDSPQQCLGTSVFQITSKSYAELVRANDLQIMQRQRGCILHEDMILEKTDTFMQFLTLKFPWYNLNNDLMGVFGLSVELNSKNMAQALSDVIFLQFLKTFHANNIQSYLPCINGIHLTKREMEIIRYTVKGYTAKKISLALQISARTIEKHLANAKTKLHAYNKSDLIEMMSDKFL